MLSGFKDFLSRGNIVELAVAVVIGVAFTALVDAFGASFVEPLLGLVLGGGVDGGTFEVDGQVFDVGGFINAVIVFLVTAAVVYFVFVVPAKKYMGAFAEPGDPKDVQLLAEIRDLLQQQGAGATGDEVASRRSDPAGGPGG